MNEPAFDAALQHLVRVALEVFRGIVREELACTHDERTVATPLPAPPELLTTREAAAIARVGERTVRAWVRSGKLSPRSAGRLLRVDRAYLERFLASSGSDGHRSVDVDGLAADILQRRRKK